ncbi:MULTISPECIES: sugar ABC transporter permease [unclassified Streptomyces]|uniref:carbohydrate ABC transporter permease n=1 Tax=Streptomyces TaxID=1883 RepID=UPI0001C18B68|nr:MULTISPECIES: sugar ABC transporter permease [unclassified Streptomyces]AEN13273.1 binding-protein-dependent transport systems inner membrane component [Streptomyces sp. SirexAA-E]MYR65282.1 ABC transporter permease subunit [Streptomyces sp. SID4939]MYS04844.1 ABC transporter permease subunit [Streptomyces sp. SID4940]MYT67277.1 ABC transporter permease subunit [Streptomyces sp. SID8357]MYT88037.1 ABC transporter permease subunit [Streptomyces sp. SID8360]
MTMLSSAQDGASVRRPSPPSPPPVAGPRRKQGGVILAVPALVWYLVFMVGPLVAIFVIAALHWPGMLQPISYAGLDNVRAVVDDPVFWESVRNTAVQLVLALPVMIVGAYMLGYYVAQNPPGHRVLRYLLFIPGLVSTPAKAMVFYAVLSPDGLVNGALDTVGLSSLTDAWLASPSTALLCLVLLDVWSGIGFTAVLFAARLGSVPAEVGEAAQLDGAGHWRAMWRIHFPVIRDFVGVVTMLQFLWTLFGSAQNVLLLTQGGPGSSSTTLSFLVYQKAFIAADLGYSQTVGVVLFLVGLVGLLTIRRVFRQNY